MKISVVREKNLNIANRKTDSNICEYEGETPRIGDILCFDGEIVGQVQSVARKIMSGKEVTVEARI